MMTMVSERSSLNFLTSKMAEKSVSTQLTVLPDNVTLVRNHGSQTLVAVLGFYYDSALVELRSKGFEPD